MTTYSENRVQRNAEADDLLKSLTVEQLRAGLERGEKELALLEALDSFDPSDDFDGPFPPSKQFENWNASFSERRRLLLHSAVSDTKAELRRRGY